MISFSESDSNRKLASGRDYTTSRASGPQQSEAPAVKRKWISPEEQKILVCMDVDCDIQTNLDDHVTIMCCSVSTAKPSTEITTTEPFPPTVPTVATSTIPPAPTAPTTPFNPLTTPQQPIWIKKVCVDVVCNGKRSKITIICCQIN